MNTKKNVSVMVAFVGGVLITILLATQLAFVSIEHPKNEKVRYQWHAPDLPQQLDFAGEAAPLKRWDIRERLDRELLFNFYDPPNVLYMLKLANRYFPLISERLKANGIPDDFKYLCVAESNLMAVALSRSGAASFWQFLGKTAPDMNLTINSEVDQRYDLRLATDAACRYLRQAYTKLGSWTAAAASYNCGITGYTNQASFQKTRYYYDLLLPEETNRYIFKILTFKYLMENSKKLGFELQEEEKYMPVAYRLIRVSSSIADLAVFARNNGSTYQMLMLMNPWLKSKSLTVRAGKTYEIMLPAA